VALDTLGPEAKEDDMDDEVLEMARDMGVHLIPCQMTMDMLGLRREDLSRAWRNRPELPALCWMPRTRQRFSSREATMSDVSVEHIRGDRFLIRVRDHDLVVDQPLNIGGDDLGPTPTELFVASLAACVAFYAGRFLRRHGLPTEGLGVETDFAMSVEGHSRVVWVDLQLELPAGFPESRREALLRVVDHCTVHNSIREAPEVRIEIREPVPVA
jgi:putative redox protein